MKVLNVSVNCLVGRSTTMPKLGWSKPGKGFGAWLNENASRQVPVNGEMVSLKQVMQSNVLLL